MYTYVLSMVSIDRTDEGCRDQYPNEVIELQLVFTSKNHVLTTDKAFWGNQFITHASLFQDWMKRMNINEGDNNSSAFEEYWGRWSTEVLSKATDPEFAYDVIMSEHSESLARNGILIEIEPIVVK